MRRTAACVLLLVLALAGCGSDSSRDDDRAAARARAEARAHARRMELGRAVFAEHCAACHTLAGRRFRGPIIEWKAPNLDQVKLRRAYVRDRVDYGGPAMASFAGELSRAEYEAIIDYVTETAGGEVADDGDHPQELLAEGRAVFDRHCAACHGIAGREMTGRPTYPGMDFTVLKPSEAFVIARIKEGVLPEDPGGLMPSFRGKLTDAQMRAVAAYVTATAGE